MAEVSQADVEIRRADASDADALARTIVQAFEMYRGRLDPQSGALFETADTIRAELHDGAGAFLAKADGQVVGCVMTKVVDDDLYFGRLSVEPQARGRSIGRRLVEAVEAEAARSGRPGVRLSVRIALPQNQRFFASLGYRESGRQSHPGFDQPTFINMRKPLD
jgi:predicted N-acetyltransferase YhbS